MVEDVKQEYILFFLGLLATTTTSAVGLAVKVLWRMDKRLYRVETRLGIDTSQIRKKHL